MATSGTTWQVFSNTRGDILDIIKADVDLPSGVVLFEDPPVHTMHRGLTSMGLHSAANGGEPSGSTAPWPDTFRVSGTPFCRNDRGFPLCHGVPNQVVKASRNPVSVPSPTQAT